ncbi:MAG: hypothetical protein K9L70_10365 [Thiohalocapsa sp.]|nr:hypothetical protein [Thiohalocapsa sp.]MCF7993492.1 hypothetical protein [Chromatiaceae bacterium]
MPARRYLSALTLSALSAAAVVANAEPVPTVGNLAAAQTATVVSQGVDVKLRPGQDYVVFSGDRIKSAAGDKLSRLAIPEAGTLSISGNTALAMDRAGDDYLLKIAHGEVGFELKPGARVVLQAGDERYDLGLGTGKGGISISPDGSEGYLVKVDEAGGTKVTYLTTGEIVLEDQRDPGIIYAQVGATDDDDDDRAGALLGGAGAGAGAAGGAGGAALAGGMSAAALASAAALPAVLAASLAVVAAAEDSLELTGSTRRANDAGPASPVGPGN